MNNNKIMHKCIIFGIFMIFAGIIGQGLASSEPTISIIGDNNKVKFKNFDTSLTNGDIWNITMFQGGKLVYQFNGKIRSDPWFVTFEHNQSINNSVNICAQNGSFNIIARGLHDNIVIASSEGVIRVDVPACDTPIPFVPELNSMVLMTVGLIGILLVSRRYKDN